MNKVFIATSLDGFIADKDGNLDWLTSFPAAQEGDAGYTEFMSTIDALVMGRKTFEKVLSFGIPWPYEKPVYVLSHSLTQVPSELVDKVWITQRTPMDLIEELKRKGFNNLYIDGGQVIQSFLNEGLLHEVILTQVPVLLGEGIPLWKKVRKSHLKLLCSKSYSNGFVQSHYQIMGRDDA